MRWRPIKSAPKDQSILLSFTGSDGEERFAAEGRWIECPPEGYVMRLWGEGKKDKIEWTTKGHWEVARVAILQHGGALDGYSFEARSWEPYDITHWMPLPKPTRGPKS